MKKYRLLKKERKNFKKAEGDKKMIKNIKAEGFSHCKIITCKGKKKFYISVDNRLMYKIITNYQEETMNPYFYWYTIEEEGEDKLINSNDILFEFRELIIHEIMLLIDYYIF